MKLYKSKKWLEQKYRNGWTLKEIAAEAGCSESTIWNWLVFHNIVAGKRNWTK